MTEVKLCINCNNCYRNVDESGNETYSCHRPTYRKSLVDGKTILLNSSCSWERCSEGKCGTEGKLFEQKRGD